MLTFEHAIGALERFQTPVWNQARGKFEGKLDVSFFGGEPLLNWEVIFKVAEWQKERAKKMKMPWHCHITSNGTRVTEEIAEYCAENNFSWIISLDGPENIHDNNRPYHKGTGSWKDTMRGLNFINAAYKKLGKQAPITLRATFDKTGLDLVDVLAFLNNLMYEGKATHVSVEPSSLGESCTVDGSRFETITDNEIIAQFESQYMKSAEWFLNELNQGKKPSFHHFEMPLQRLYDRQFAFSECGAGKGYFSIGPGGKISACHRENEAFLGNLDEGVDKAKQSKWLDNRIHVRECEDCWHRFICGGGCRHDSLQAGLAISRPVKVECIFKQMQMRAVLWLMGEMSEKQRKLYSQLERQQKQQVQPGPHKKQCTDPNCKCHEK